MAICRQGGVSFLLKRKEKCYGQDRILPVFVLAVQDYFKIENIKDP